MGSFNLLITHLAVLATSPHPQLLSKIHLINITKDNLIAPKGFRSSVSETGMKTKYIFFIINHNNTATIHILRAMLHCLQLGIIKEKRQYSGSGDCSHSFSWPLPIFSKQNWLCHSYQEISACAHLSKAVVSISEHACAKRCRGACNLQHFLEQPYHVRSFLIFPTFLQEKARETKALFQNTFFFFNRNLSKMNP